MQKESINIYVVMTYVAAFGMGLFLATKNWYPFAFSIACFAVCNYFIYKQEEKEK